MVNIKGHCLRIFSGSMAFIRKHSKRGFKYACVGTSGFLIDAAVLYYLTQFIHIWYVASELFATLVTFASNYLLNTYWTYRDAMKKLQQNEITAFSLASGNNSPKTELSET